MKKRHVLPGILALALATIVSCSDEEKSTGQSKIRIYGVDYELTSGVLWHSSDHKILSTQAYLFTDHFTDDSGIEQTVESKGFTVGDSAHTNGNFLLSLYGAGLSYNPDLHVASGKDACICFHLASPDTEELTPGAYRWGNEKEDFTFTAFYNSVYDPEGLSSIPAEISAGKVMISRNDKTWTVDFDCKTEYGAEIKGVYTGYLDTCRIESQDIGIHSDVRIEALLDTVKSLLWCPEWGMEEPMDWSTPGPDFYQGKAFFSTAGGAVATAEESSGNGNVDIALAYRRAGESVVFESPLKMCVWLRHQYECADIDGNPKKLIFPCHTRYQLAPKDFTENDYEKIRTSGDLDFTIAKDAGVEIPFNTNFPKYVFFETGKGVRGVIKIKETTPFYVKQEDVSEAFEVEEATLTTYINPSVLLDVKYVSSLTDMKIR